MPPNFDEIARERYVSLGSFRRDGREVRTPVWVAGDGDRLYVFSAGDAGKVKRIRATGRVRLAGCDARGTLHARRGGGDDDAGAWLAGAGRVVGDEPDVLARGYAALRRKYGWQMWAADAFSRLGGRYHRRALLEIEVG